VNITSELYRVTLLKTYKSLQIKEIERVLNGEDPNSFPPLFVVFLAKKQDLFGP